MRLIRFIKREKVAIVVGVVNTSGTESHGTTSAGYAQWSCAVVLRLRCSGFAFLQVDLAKCLCRVFF